MGRRRSVEFEDVDCIRETDMALLVVLEDGREKWLPKSAVHDDSEVYKNGDKGTLHVFEWFIDKNGWPDE